MSLDFSDPRLTAYALEELDEPERAEVEDPGSLPPTPTPAGSSRRSVATARLRPNSSSTSRIRSSPPRTARRSRPRSRPASGRRISGDDMGLIFVLPRPARPSFSWPCPRPCSCRPNTGRSGPWRWLPPSPSQPPRRRPNAPTSFSSAWQSPRPSRMPSLRPPCLPRRSLRVTASILVPFQGAS